MTSIQQRRITSLERDHLPEKKINSSISPDEKTPTIDASSVEASIDVSDGDEALVLVGMHRTAQFSEDYNLKLRRKLARFFLF